MKLPKEIMEKHKAFTLIELLVVIAIIALLLAILMPSLRRARNSARAVVCQSRLKQWGTIFYMYTEYNHYRFVNYIGDALWFIRGSQLKEGDPNVAPMSTYVNAKGIGCCPMAARPPADSTRQFRVGSGSYTLIGMEGSVFESWKLKSPTPEFYGSYGFNYELFQPTFYPNVHDRQVFGSGINVLNLDRAYRFPVLLDCTTPLDSISVSRLPYFTSNDFCINRHGGCINGLFMDWSVRKIGLKELWTLKWNMNFDTANRWTLAGGVKPEDWPEWMRGFKDY